MSLAFEASRGDPYKGRTQKIKNLSEHWVSTQAYCANCGKAGITQYRNNQPVADLFCEACSEDYELKSQARKHGTTVPGGAYSSMVERLQSNNPPNFLFLHYDAVALSVVNLMLVPKYFLIPAYIEKRKPLSPLAQRAGWVGCKILISEIPLAGRILVIKDRAWQPKEQVLAQWRSTLFLRDQRNADAKGWLLNVMKCIEQIRKPVFSIDEIYRCEGQLRAAYPSNQHIREKIRQKLQILRDKGYLEFLGGGNYRLVDGRAG